MKKIILTLILLFIALPNVNASEVNIKWMKNVFANQSVNGNTYYAQLGIIYVDSKIAYCIEPGVAVTNFTYNKYSINTIINNQDLTQLLELIYYYGYGYKDHTTDKFYMATQALIWKLYNNSESYFTTRSNYQGEVINVDSEKKIIMDLVNKNMLKPSFDGLVVEEEKNKKVVLYDNNEVLENYEVYSNSIKFEKINNRLVFNTDDGNISLLRNNQESSFVYKQQNSQTLVTFGLNLNINSKISIKNKIVPNELCIIKKDSISKSIIKEVAKFEIKNLEDNKTSVYETVNGEFCTDLYKGNYQIKEIDSPVGYIIDKQVYDIEIIEDTKMDFYNKKIIMPKTGYKVNKSSLIIPSIILLLSLKIALKND